MTRWGDQWLRRYQQEETRSLSNRAYVEKLEKAREAFPDLEPRLVVIVEPRLRAVYGSRMTRGHVREAVRRRQAEWDGPDAA